MSLQFLQPFAGTHAIQQVNFTFHWAPLPLGAGDHHAEACVEELGAAMRGLGLQGVTPLNTLQFQLAVGATAPMAMTPSTVGGYEGRLPAVGGSPGFVVTAAAQDGLTVQVAPYTRWAPVVSRVLDFAGALIPVAAKVVPLLRIGLQVVDTFHWNAPVNELPVDAVFSRASPWLAPHVFECRTFWHCNHGFFEPAQLSGCTRQLNNVNISVSGAAERPMIQAALVHLVELDAGGWWLRESGGVQRIAEVLDQLHASNKTSIGQLLSSEVAERVALWGTQSQENSDGA